MFTRSHQIKLDGVPAPHLKPRASDGSFAASALVLALAGTLESIPDAKSHGNSGNWVACAGFFTDRSQPRRSFFAFESAGARAGDSGIPARHLVTELRKTHGPV